MIIQLCAEIAGVNVDDHLSGVVPFREIAPRQLVQRKAVRPADFHRAVHGRAHGQIGQRRRHIVGGDRLDQRRRQAHSAILRARLDDAADELEELRRAQDGIGNLQRLDEVFLRDLGAEVLDGRPDVTCPQT